MVSSNIMMLSPVSPPRSLSENDRPGDPGSRPGGTTMLGVSILISPLSVEIRTQSTAQRHQPLHHVVARESGRVAVDRRGDVVALLLVKAGRLDAERRQRDPRAAASPALFFGHRQYAAADP